MRHLFQKHKLNNQGSTMVEVLVGFTILVLVIVECMVHIVGMSRNMVLNSKDMVNAIHTLNEQMYTKEVIATDNTNPANGYTRLDGVTIRLYLSENTDTGVQSVNLPMKHAVVDLFECEAADLSQLRIRYEE